jgi:hypothetical protein
VARGDMQ